jgi:hypothetical protein
MSFVKDLDTPLLRLSPFDNFTLRDACAGVHAFGGIGAGKTTALKMLAGAYLRAGMGAVITSVKSEEIDLWRRYAAEHGRENSLILFDGQKETFNFLAYELGRQGMDGINSVTECLMRVLDSGKRASPTASQRGGEAFWEDATRQLLRYSIPMLYSATGTLNIGDLIGFITTAPTSLKQSTDEEWQRKSFMYQVMEAATHQPKIPMSDAALHDALTYWAVQYPAIPDRTMGNLVISASTTLDRFKHGRLNRAFCGRTTVVPEMTFSGSIIVLAMPTLTLNEDGIIAQQLFKGMWQRAVLSRNGLAEKHRERPVCLWSDEAQETVSPYDAEYQSICRGSKACTVYLTQSLPTYYAKMGGDNPRDAAHALVGKFNTHLYFSNACADTNEYSSRTIGKIPTRRTNFSTGTSESMNEGMSSGNSENRGRSSNTGGGSSSSPGQSGRGHNSNYGSGHNDGTGSNWGSNRGRGTSETVSHGYSESMEFAIEPGYFARGLKSGGKPHGHRVTSIWFQGGRIFKASGSNFMLETFRQ